MLQLPLITVLALTAAAVSSTDGRVARLEKLALYVGGARAGTLTYQDEPLEGGGWRLTRDALMEVKRGGLELKLRSRSVSEVDAQLRPRRFTYEREEAGGRLVHQGKATCNAKGCRMHVISELGGSRNESSVDLPAGVTLSAALEVRVRQQLATLPSFSGQAFSEEMAVIHGLSYKVSRVDTGYRVDTTMTVGNGKVATVDLLDGTGRTIRSETAALNAVAVPEGSPPPASDGTTLDVLKASTWTAPRKPSGLRKARFTLTTQKGDVADVPTDRRQKVVQRSGGRVVVEVSEETTGLPESITPAERRKALASTPYEPVKDPRVREAAKKARGNANTPREIVRNVTLWVKNYVEDKSLARAYAPATATLETRQGDCTEHSVLTSALLKANGIPTRLADGVIWFDARLGYHEWVEVWLDGEGWVPVDPTFGEPRAGPNRVKFITGSSDPSDLMGMGLSAAQAFRGLKVTVEAVQ